MQFRRFCPIIVPFRFNIFIATEDVDILTEIFKRFHRTASIIYNGTSRITDAACNNERNAYRIKFNTLYVT